MLAPIIEQEEYAERELLFSAMSNEELIDDYNRVHASQGIDRSNLRYLSHLCNEIQCRKLPIPKSHEYHEFRYWARYWIARLKVDPDYSKKRFKIPKGNSYSQHLYFDPDLVDRVSDEEFLSIEADRIPLGLGCQFGIHPRMIQDENSPFYNGEKLVALLAKSVLSGNVAGLKIYKIVKEDKKFKHRVVEFFPNTKL